MRLFHDFRNFILVSESSFKRHVDFRNAEAAVDDEVVLVSEALNFGFLPKMHIVYIRFR